MDPGVGGWQFGEKIAALVAAARPIVGDQTAAATPEPANLAAAAAAWSVDDVLQWLTDTAGLAELAPQACSPMPARARATCEGARSQFGEQKGFVAGGTDGRLGTGLMGALERD